MGCRIDPPKRVSWSAYTRADRVLPNAPLRQWVLSLPFELRGLAGGAFLARPAAPKRNPDADMERRERRFSASSDGFDVHCAVRIAADDDQGRERLVRYCARPPFALDRIEGLADGRVAYLLKVPRRGRTHRVMTPMEFMARLAMLIPTTVSECTW